MHVGLNLVYLVPGRTGGMEVHARELIQALVRERPEVRFTAFIGREAAEVGGGPWGELIPAVTVPVRSSRRSEWVRGEQQHVPRLAARARIDLLHSLGSTAPVWGSFRRVVTIHDVIYRIYPRAHPGLRSLGMRVLVPLAARRSHRIIVPSRNTRDDLVRLLRVPAEKIDVIHPGHGSPSSVTPVDEETLRRRYDLDGYSVVLAPSGKQRHKNLVRLLEALALIPLDRRPVLFLPGYTTHYEGELQQRAADLGLQEHTRFTGWVSDAELEGLYRIAACLVFPSLYEGFGAPVLEAMARGVPVACSDRASLPEVAGGAARLFDPEQPGAIAAAIEELLGDHGVADRLRAAGYARAREITWGKSARETFATYERALASPSE